MTLVAAVREAAPIISKSSVLTLVKVTGAASATAQTETLSPAS